MEQRPGQKWNQKWIRKGSAGKVKGKRKENMQKSIFLNPRDLEGFGSPRHLASRVLFTLSPTLTCL